MIVHMAYIMLDGMAAAAKRLKILRCVVLAVAIFVVHAQLAGISAAFAGGFLELPVDSDPSFVPYIVGPVALRITRTDSRVLDTPCFDSMCMCGSPSPFLFAGRAHLLRAPGSDDSCPAVGALDCFLCSLLPF